MQHIHDLSLHSTMFLLILIAVKLLLGLQAFTFHDVSINTHRVFYPGLQNASLHSTMFLLIRSSNLRYLPYLSFFTFHDVSINTEICFRRQLLMLIIGGVSMHSISVISPIIFSSVFISFSDSSTITDFFNSG